MASAPAEIILVRVRNAVREAVGGWGLYTVSQIASLFADEEFTPSGEDIGDYGGQRRTECELHQAGRPYPRSPARSCTNRCSSIH
jgi:hypothetical protein